MSFPSEGEEKKKKGKKNNLAYQVPEGEEQFLKTEFLRRAILILEHL